MLWIAEGDRPAVVDEDCRHSHAVDVDPAFAAIDSNPLPTVVMHHDVGGSGRPVDPDIGRAVAADGHVPADGEGESLVSEPDDQRGSECFRRHSHHLPRPSAWAESASSTRHNAPAHPGETLPLAKRPSYLRLPRYARSRGRRGILEKSAQHCDGIR